MAIMVIAILLGLLFAAYLLYKPHTSIINYLPYVYGLVYFLTGLYFFLVSFGIYNPKYKTEEQQLKVAGWLNRRGKLWKFGSIFLMLYGTYTLIRHDPNMYRLDSAIENEKWTNKDKAVLMKMCLRDVGFAAKKYPQITFDYCTCTTDKIMQGMGRKEYIDVLSKSADVQYKIDSPFIQGCLIIFSRQVDSIKKQAK